MQHNNSSEIGSGVPVWVQPVQSLESRRLMSHANGFELVLPQEHGGPIDSLQAMPAGDFRFQGSNVPASLPDFQSLPATIPTQALPPMALENDWVDDQLAHATAQGTAFTFDANDATGAARAQLNVNPPTTLWALYATLPTSTVASVDTASPGTSSSIRRVAGKMDAVGADEAVLPTLKAPVFTDTNQQGRATLLPTESREMTRIPESANAGHPIAIEAPIAPPNSLPVTSSALISRHALLSIEHELNSVKTFSQDLSRKMGLTFSDASSDGEASTSVFATALSRWQSAAAIVGATVASIVYAQSEICCDRKKTGVAFSDRLITLPA